jgi:hypothetical protein
VINQADIRLVQYRVGHLRIDPLQIKGEGGPLMPALVLPVELDLHEADGKKLVLERLQAELVTRPGTGPRVRLGLPVAIEWGARSDTRPLSSVPRGASHSLELRIDLLSAGLRLLDAHVQATTQGPVMLALYFEARLGLMEEESMAEVIPSLGNPSLWSARRFWSASVDELEIQLSREHWAEQVAPALGHDRVRLVAVSLPSPGGWLDTNVVPIFDAASRAYDAADWREAIQKCRDVRHHIEQQVRGTSQDGSVAQVVAQRLGVEEDDPRIRFLDSTWKALADVTNEAHHIDSIGRLQAATAHAALLITATMVQHVAELLGPA